jgi:hypothetical protein
MNSANKACILCTKLMNRTHNVKVISMLSSIHHLYNYISNDGVSSSSSSLAQQPCVGPGLPQKILPAKDLAIASSDFVMSIFQGGVVSPMPDYGV